MMREDQIHSTISSDHGPATPSNATLSLSDRGSRLGLTVLTGYVFTRSLLQAASKPLWFDEVCTWAVIRQGTFAGMWRALASAADGQPPVFYFIEKCFSGLVPNQHLALRLPSILAFCVVLWCVFEWTRTYAGGVIALICSASLLLFPLFDPYAVEARPYALLAAFLAVALICYQRVSNWKWVVILALSLCLAESVHYYAIFAVIPFGLAEIAVLIRQKLLRFWVWIALCSPIIPLAVFWPLLSKFKSVYAAHYWSPANSWTLMSSYYKLVKALIPIPLHQTTRIAVTSCVVIGCLAVAIFMTFRGFYGSKSSAPKYNELVLVAALASYPIILFAAASITRGGFTERYTLPGVTAMCLTLGYVIRTARKRALWLIIAFLAISLVRLETRFWQSARSSFWTIRPAAATIEDTLSSVDQGDLPIVISDSMDALPFAYYGSPRWSKRTYVLLDPEKARIYARSDSNDLELGVLKEFVPIQTDSLEDFQQLHPRFILYSSSGGQYSSDWWPNRLTSEGYQLKILKSVGVSFVYLVDASLHK